ncbi:transcription regulator [Peptostreptococcus anaerobius CAG:621]|nr:transcription regulator [Peptostreptococcus anaerobius CAG:621]
MNTSDKIKKYRQERKYKQSELAGKLGITVNTLSNYERGITKPTSEMLLKISDILEISVDDLISEYDVSIKDLNQNTEHLISILINKTLDSKIEWDSYIGEADPTADIQDGIKISSAQKIIFRSFDNINKHTLFYTKLKGCEYSIFIFTTGANNSDYYLVISSTEDSSGPLNLDYIKVYQSENLPKLLDVIKSKCTFDVELLKRVINILK